MCEIFEQPSPAAALDILRESRPFFTVTPGRSGTKLLASLMSACMGVRAEHESAPRLNYVLRAVQAAPEAAGWWLYNEKLPMIAANQDERPYADTSHLYCKGFLEPIVELGLRPRIIILKRPAREVALSMLAIRSIPERTSSGRLVLVGPTDPGVLPAPGWHGWDDYQLCFWYAREIERRQQYYARRLPNFGSEVHHVSMAELTDFDGIQALAKFVAGPETPRVDEQAFTTIVSKNHNARESITATAVTFVRPSDDYLDAHEAQVDAAIRLMS